MRLYVALFETDRLEIFNEQPVGLISHVLQVDPEDRCYEIVKRAQTDRDYRWALSDILVNFCEAARISASQLRQMTTATH